MAQRRLGLLALVDFEKLFYTDNMKKLIVLIIVAAFCAPGPVFAVSLETPFHAENSPQALNLAPAPLDIDIAPADGVSNKELEQVNIEDKETLPAPLIQQAAPKLSFASIVAEPKVKPNPIQKIKRRVSGVIKYTKKALSVNRQNITGSLAQFFDRSQRFSNPVKESVGVATPPRRPLSLKPWDTAAVMAGAAASMAGVQIAVAAPIQALQNAPVHHSSGASMLTYLTLTVAAIVFTDWVIKHWKKTAATTSLMTAAYYGDIDAVKRSIAAGADVNAEGSSGMTALILAAMYGRADIIKLLIAAGADVNARAVSSYGDTALMIAARYGYADVVKLLIAAGAPGKE